MGRNLIETVLGAVVLAVAGGFLIFAYNQGAGSKVDGYKVLARFDDLSGIATGSEVRIGGMKIGVVDGLSLDQKTYQATAHLTIQEQVKLPKDTSAAIASAGLLGDKFIKLEPGGDESILKSGDMITFTQSSISLEELIGKFMFSGGGVDDKNKAAAPAPQPAAESVPTESGKVKGQETNPFSLGF